MQSYVSVCNTALARLGGDQLGRFNSPDEDGAIPTLCRTLFPQTVDFCLAWFPWSFARKRVFLALKGDGSEAYALRYALPADCLRPVEIVGEIKDHAPVPYVIEGADLLTAQADAQLVYVARLHDPACWTPIFADAVAWGLAAELSTPLINDPRRQQVYAEHFQRALADASGADMAMQRPDRHICPWLEERG